VPRHPALRRPKLGGLLETDIDARHGGSRCPRTDSTAGPIAPAPRRLEIESWRSPSTVDKEENLAILAGSQGGFETQRGRKHRPFALGSANAPATQSPLIR
jgi:hypothetical protein